MLHCDVLFCTIGNMIKVLMSSLLWLSSFYKRDWTLNCPS